MIKQKNDNMKTSRNNKRFWLTALLLVVILSLVPLSAAMYFHKWPFSARQEPQSTDTSINYDVPTDSQVKEGSETKQEVIDSSKQDGQNNNDTDTTDIGFDITVAEKSGDIYLVRTIIQTVSSGTCTIQMNGPNNATYSATVEVQPMANTSTCKGFNVPMSNLSSGAWTISVTYSNGDTSASTKKEVTI